MASKKKGNKSGKKIITINFSWIYFLLIPFVVWMLYRSSGGSANPQKIEWDEVKTMAEAGDIEEIQFIRNEYEGRVNMLPASGASSLRNPLISFSLFQADSMPRKCSELLTTHSRRRTGSRS